MYDPDAGEAGKPGFVECQDGGKTVNLHRRHKAGVVRRLSGYFVLRDKRLPYGVDFRGIG